MANGTVPVQAICSDVFLHHDKMSYVIATNYEMIIFYIFLATVKIQPLSASDHSIIIHEH